MADDTGMLEDVEPAEASDRKETWKRGLFMLLCVFAFGVGQTLLILLAIVQFMWLLFSKVPNPNLVRFGKSLSVWLAEAARFLSCDTNQKPFPWSSWPHPLSARTASQVSRYLR